MKSVFWQVHTKSWPDWVLVGISKYSETARAHMGRERPAKEQWTPVW